MFILKIVCILFCFEQFDCNFTVNNEVSTEQEIENELEELNEMVVDIYDNTFDNLKLQYSRNVGLRNYNQGLNIVELPQKKPAPNKNTQNKKSVGNSRYDGKSTANKKYDCKNGRCFLRQPESSSESETSCSETDSCSETSTDDSYDSESETETSDSDASNDSSENSGPDNKRRKRPICSKGGCRDFCSPEVSSDETNESLLSEDDSQNDESSSTSNSDEGDKNNKEEQDSADHDELLSQDSNDGRITREVRTDLPFLNNTNPLVINVNTPLIQHSHDFSTVPISDLEFLRKKINEITFKEEGKSSVIPKAADSFDNIDIWYPHVKNNNIKYTEEPVIRDITWNDHFEINLPVDEWYSVKNKAAGRHHNKLTLVSFHDEDIHIAYKEVSEEISTISMFEWWNDEERTLETILITAIDARVDWYYFTGDNRLEQFWSWELQDPINHINVFYLNKELRVLISFKNYRGDAYGHYSGIFSVTPWRDWWLEQRFQVGGKSATIDQGKFIFISDPDKGLVNSYLYSPKQRLYSLNDVIRSREVNELCTFTSGSDSFLAVGGENSNIYLVKSGALQAVPVEHYNLSFVERYLAMPVDYLWDTAILLVQQELDYDTHSSKTIEALRWNGKVFELMEHAPCYKYGEAAESFTCILDGNDHMSIFGASALTTKNTTSVLLSSNRTPPLLFNIKMETKPLIDPIYDKIRQTLQIVKRLQEKFINQNMVMRKLKANVQKNHGNRHLIGRNWNLRKLKAPVIRLKEDKGNEGFPSEIYINGKKFNNPKSMSTKFYTELIKIHNKKIRDIIQTLKKSVKKDSQATVAIPIIFLNGLTVNGQISIDNATIENLNNMNVDKVLHNVQSKHIDNRLHIKEKYFENVETRKLYVYGSINGINIFDKEIQSKPSIVFNNDVYLNASLKVSGNIEVFDGGLVNNINLSENVVRSDQYMKTLQFESLSIKNNFMVKDFINNVQPTIDGLEKMRSEYAITDLIKNTKLKANTLHINGDIKLSLIKNESWYNFEENLVFTNTPIYLDNLNVKGKITVKGKTKLSALNSLYYPSEYVTTNEYNPVSITGKKVFKIITGKKVYCKDAINGIRLDDIVRSDKKEHLGNYTFENLFVNNEFLVKGNITGQGLEKNIYNPSLLQSKEIKGNIFFTNLNVDGPIKIIRQFNNTSLKNLRKDIYFKADSNIMVDSNKEFQNYISVKNGLKIKSNNISSLNLSSLLTKNAFRNNKDDIILNNVIIHSIILNGTYGGTNFTDILNDAIHVNKDQLIHGVATFEYKRNNEINNNYFEENSADPLLVNKLTITNTLNDWKVDDVLLLSKDIQTIKHKNVNLKYLKAKTLIVQGNIQTDYNVSGIDLRYFDKTRLSVTRDQEITGQYSITNCSSYNNSNFEYINSCSSTRLLSFYNKFKEIKDKVFTGKIPVNFLRVQKLFTNGINNKYLSEIEHRAINLNTENIIFSNVTFLDSPQMNKLDVKGYFNNEYFANFIKNVFYQDDKTITVRGSLLYTNPLKITETLAAKYLNKININEDIFDKSGNIDIKQPTQIIGNVIVKNNLDISGYFNQIYLDYIDVYINKKCQAVYKNDVYFTDGHEIKNLVLSDLINNEYDFKAILGSVIWLNGSQKVNLDVSFSTPTRMKSHVNVKSNYNDLDINKLFNDIIDIDGYFEMDNKVVFSDYVYVNNTLKVNNEINSEMINNINFKKWKDQSIDRTKPKFIQEKQYFMKASIKGNLNLVDMNNRRIDHFVTRSTKQYIPQATIENLNVQKSLTVEEYINSIDLRAIRNNCLMKYGNQVINTPLSVHSRVHINNNNISTLNGENINNILNTKTYQKLYGNYIFSGNINVDYLNITGTVNNYDISWTENGLFSNEYGQNEVLGNVAIKENLYLDKFNADTVIIGGKNISEMKYNAIQNEQLIESVANDFYIKYNTICKKVEKLRNYVNNKIKHFKYFEIQEEIVQSDVFFNYFEVHGRNFLLLRDNNSCETQFWLWNPIHENFEKWLKIDTGKSMKWKALQIENHSLLLSRVFENDCQHSSGIWEVTNNTIQFRKEIPEHYFHMQAGTNKKDDAGIEYIQKELNISVRLVENNQSALPKINTLKIPNKCLEKHIFTPGRNNLVSAACILSDRIEIYSSYNTIYQIPAENPRNFQHIRLNDYESIIVFINKQDNVVTYKYQGVTGYKYAYIIYPKAQVIMVVYLEKSSGTKDPFLLVKNQYKVLLIKAVYSYIKESYQCN